MSEILYKLSPHRDLQCYFERPSAIAAMSAASASGYTVSGAWRQQFDWAVIEWNVDNVFEHPVHRYLPDGDLSGLVLSYEEERDNCIPMDSDLYATVDWPYLRVWTRDNGVDDFFQVRLRDHATPVAGSYVAAWAEMELAGTPAAGDYAGFSFQDEHHTYQVLGSDTLATTVQAIVDSVNTFSTRLTATRDGSKIRLEMADPTTGANANRLGLYGFVTGSGLAWTPWFRTLGGGTSPTRWRVDLDFSSLVAIDGRAVPMSKARKMRWTYSAEMQPGAYQRTEFEARISNWTVTGAGRQYWVAGPGSRRIEDYDPAVAYSGAWTEGRGNFSRGSIRHTVQPNAAVSCDYTCPQPHRLYLGSRYTFNSGTISVQVDSQPARTINLFIAGEDTLARIDLGPLGPGQHSVTARHTGASGVYFYFDFIEVAVPAAELPDFPATPVVNLATDWDTDHSLATPAERTAWMIHKLGFRGRQNHYVGALVFYDMVRDGHQYASATVTFPAAPVFSQTTSLTLGTAGSSATITINHVNRIGDTGATLAKAFELELNRGYTAVRATSSGNVLTVWARAMGELGHIVLVNGSALTGGVNGEWHTDLEAIPRVNRACMDWSRAFYSALASYGIEVTAAFSTELQHGDTSLAAGIAQRYPSGNPVVLNTPAIQTNFSPTSIDYWKQVHLDMARAMVEAGVAPYIQFGEVQWWYFPYDGSGMPFYDAYTTSRFLAEHGRPMATIANGGIDPALHPEEAAFVATLIGEYTDACIDFVRATYPGSKFEVLYPNDVNAGAFNRVANYPPAAWTPAKLDCLKTESFTFTFERNLDLARTTVDYPATRGFPRDKSAFLVGLMDPFTAWHKEVNFARSANIESIVLFALDQFCLMGYALPMPRSLRRCARQG
jgi:hypothetical protein